MGGPMPHYHHRNVGVCVEECKRFETSLSCPVPDEEGALYQTRGVMLLGEAPGKEERDGLQPFIGPAGGWLNRAIAESGYPNLRDHFYLLNVVRCYAKGNPPPTKAEIEFHRPFVLEAIYEADPACIVLLGAIPLKFFSVTGGVGSRQGQRIPWEGRILCPTYHPSYAMRTRSDHYREKIGQDIKMAWDLAQQIKNQPKREPIREIPRS